MNESEASLELIGTGNDYNNKWTRLLLHNYINPGYGLSLVDTLWNASS